MPLPIFGACPPLKPRTDCVRHDGSYRVDAWLEEIVYAHDSASDATLVPTIDFHVTAPRIG